MLFTIGHGTLELPELTALITGAGIAALVDVRSHPGSRRLPQFGRGSLAAEVPAAGVTYEWRPALGGRRRPQTPSPHVALRHPSFRAYADHMMTEEFRLALDRLVSDADDGDVVIMCAEAVWWRCHRRLVADAAVLLRGRTVTHLFHDGRQQLHPPMPEARVDETGVLIYDLGVTGQLPC